MLDLRVREKMAVRTISIDRHPSLAAAADPFGRPSGSAGFALVTVIIVLGALAYLVLSITAAVRSTVRHATSSEAAMRASLAAEGGIELAIEHVLAAARRDALRHIGGKRIECLTPDGSALRLEITDDGGRIDLNIARPELLTALLLGLGRDAEAAARVSDGIADYRDSDDQRRPFGAEQADYRAAGRSGPANAAFGAVEELAHVLAISPDLYRRLLPHVTVGSRLQGIDPRHASPVLVELVARGVSQGSGGVPIADVSGRPALGGALVAASVHKSFSIRASARLRSGAVQVREASVEVVAARRAAGPPSEPRNARAAPEPAVLVTRWSHGATTPADDGLAPGAFGMAHC